MMKKLYTNILERLDLIIKETANHIHDFIDSKSDFTRKRKLDAFDDDSQLMSASAYVQQKSKLSPQCFIHILQSFNNQLIHIRLLDHKYRLFAIDGSDFDQLWNPTSKNKVTKQSPRPFCQIHVDLLNNTYQDCIFQPKAHMNERTAAVQLLKHLNVGQYIVMMDRGYTSFNLIENCNRLNNCFYVVRTKTGQGAMK